MGLPLATVKQHSKSFPRLSKQLFSPHVNCTHTVTWIIVFTFVNSIDHVVCLPYCYDDYATSSPRTTLQSKTGSSRRIDRFLRDGSKNWDSERRNRAPPYAAQYNTTASRKRCGCCRGHLASCHKRTPCVSSCLRACITHMVIYMTAFVDSYAYVIYVLMIKAN